MIQDTLGQFQPNCGVVSMTDGHGWCPRCGARIIQRERRMNGNDTCANGCRFPSKEALKERPPIKAGDAVKVVKNATELHNMEGTEHVVEDVTPAGNCIIRGILFSPDQLKRKDD